MKKKSVICVSLFILMLAGLFLLTIWNVKGESEGSRLLLTYGDKGDWTIEEAFDFDQKGCYRRTVTTTRMMKGDSKASVQGIRNGLLKLSDQYKGYVAKLVVEKDKYTTIEMVDLRLLSKKDRKDLAVEGIYGKTKAEIKNSGYTMYGGLKQSFFEVTD